MNVTDRTDKINSIKEKDKMNTKEKDMKIRQIDWRKNYEPFRGNVYEFGLYRITQEGDCYQAWHGSLRIGKPMRDWFQADEICLSKINGGK